MQGDTFAGFLSVFGCPFLTTMRGSAYDLGGKEEFNESDWAGFHGSAGVFVFQVPSQYFGASPSRDTGVGMGGTIDYLTVLPARATEQMFVYCHHHHMLLVLALEFPAQWSSEDVHAAKESVPCRVPFLACDWPQSILVGAAAATFSATWPGPRREPEVQQHSVQFNLLAREPV
ncbi:hypothetical protein DE146DRAFT_514147 [Phaeosphaeria sp. MPI-PUGE-AT-0046c]|nr:hypothetical protein DE146DRAFT_514147 [Phaeosphaeria sp. MPI-PUGE-AT-0046c]